MSYRTSFVQPSRTPISLPRLWSWINNLVQIKKAAWRRVARVECCPAPTTLNPVQRGLNLRVERGHRVRNVGRQRGRAGHNSSGDGSQDKRVLHQILT